MSPQKFSGKTSREVLHKVRQALGADALIVSNRPFDGGIEVTALSTAALDRAVQEPAVIIVPPPSAPQQQASSPKQAPAPMPATDGIVQNLMREVASMKSLLQNELSSMAWSGLQQRAPARAGMMQVLLKAGFSPLLSRQLVTVLPEQAAMPAAQKAIATEIKNLLRTMMHEALVSEGGVYALVGPTGVGKTTTVAKLAARCVVRYGAASLGLITTDSYRIAAHDQLRVYGKILGVAVHAVKDTADMAATLAKLRDKKTVLIDTVGMSQRDQLVAEQSAMLSACGVSVKRLLLLNATANAATLDEVIGAYAKGGLHGGIITKLDESASLATALDCAIRHRLTLHYVTIGQSVPEDIRLPHTDYLLHRALHPTLNAYSHDLKEEEFPLAAAMGASYA